jgi:uncharacterized protein
VEYTRKAFVISDPKPYLKDMDMDNKTKIALEAAVLRRLVAHLRTRADVQNIDLMNLAGFCRNCLSNWMQDAAKERGIELDKDTAREEIYGMPYEQWKTLNQAAATPDQQKTFAAETAKKHSH